MPNPTEAPQVIPTIVHRAACDRAVRLAFHQGAVEVLAFYDEMTPGERRVTFALLARLAGRRHLDELPADETSPWWTPAELRLAHAMWQRGHRSKWIDTGHRLYVRDRKTIERAAPAAVGSPWTPEQDAAVLVSGKSAAQIARELGRTESAIRTRRRHLRARAETAEAAS